MPKGATFCNDWLKLVFNAVAIANLADNAASNPHTLLFAALHTADPTASGNQSSSEIGYTGYQRLAVVRTSSGWTVTSASVSPLANMDFPAGTAGSGTATHASLGVGTIAAVTVTSATPGVVTLASHGFTTGMPFTFTGTTAPTGTTFGTIYYVSPNNNTTNTFQFTSSIGGGDVATSSTGTSVSIVHGKVGSTSKILYSGTVTPNIVTGNGVTPRLTTASTVTES